MNFTLKIKFPNIRQIYHLWQEYYWGNNIAFGADPVDIHVTSQCSHCSAWLFNDIELICKGYWIKWEALNVLIWPGALTTPHYTPHNTLWTGNLAASGIMDRQPPYPPPRPLVRINPWSAEIFLYKPYNFFQFDIIITVLVGSFRFIWIPMLWVCGHYKDFPFLSAGIKFWRQNLTSTTNVNSRTVRVKTNNIFFVINVF